MKFSRCFLLAIASILMLAGCNSLSDISRKHQQSAQHIKTESQRYNIMGQGVISEETMLEYLMKYNKKIPKKKAAYIVRTYIWESAYEGVNHDVAFVQMCHETNFLRFGGTVSTDQNNFCGLGTINNDIKGCYFTDMRSGIRAHIQHLKAYASTKSLANKCLDPRFLLVKRGSAKNIFALTGKWAVDPNYGQSLQQKIDVIIDMENKLRGKTKSNT